MENAKREGARDLSPQLGPDRKCEHECENIIHKDACNTPAAATGRGIESLQPFL